jgi:hypothetical protein
MRHELLTALLVAILAGEASAQVAGSFGSDTNALWANPTTTHAGTSAGSHTNAVLDGPDPGGQTSFDLAPMAGEPLIPSRTLLLSDSMAVDQGVGRSFVDSDDIQVQRDSLFRKLDLLQRANSRSSPVYFGVDREIRFVEHHEYQSGILAPVGISYRRGQQRLAFFAELAPIFDLAPSTSVGWGGGLGIRFYFDR